MQRLWRLLTRAIHKRTISTNRNISDGVISAHCIALYCVASFYIALIHQTDSHIFQHNCRTMGSMEFYSLVFVIISFFIEVNCSNCDNNSNSNSNSSRRQSNVYKVYNWCWNKTWFNSKKWALCYLFISNSGCIAPFDRFAQLSRTYLIPIMTKRQRLFHDSR